MKNFLSNNLNLSWWKQRTKTVMLLPGKLRKSERNQPGSVRASYLHVPQFSGKGWRNKQNTRHDISEAPRSLQHSGKKKTLRNGEIKASNIETKWNIAKSLIIQWQILPSDYNTWSRSLLHLGYPIMKVMLFYPVIVFQRGSSASLFVQH